MDGWSDDAAGISPPEQPSMSAVDSSDTAQGIVLSSGQGAPRYTRSSASASDKLEDYQSFDGDWDEREQRRIWDSEVW